MTDAGSEFQTDDAAHQNKNFREVGARLRANGWMSIWVVVGSLVIVLLQIFSWFWQWKKFENWSIFDKVIRHTKNVPNFLGHPAYALTLTLKFRIAQSYGWYMYISVVNRVAKTTGQNVSSWFLWACILTGREDCVLFQTRPMWMLNFCWNTIAGPCSNFAIWFHLSVVWRTDYSVHNCKVWHLVFK